MGPVEKVRRCQQREEHFFEKLAIALENKEGTFTNYRLATHIKFLSVGPDQKMVTKWCSNWSPGLLLGAFSTIFRARPD